MSDISGPSDTGAPSQSSSSILLVYLVGVAGVAFSITLLFIEMRAVLDVGGTCASGGPYAVAQPCPDGIGLMLLAIFGGLVWAALAFWAGTKIGGRYGAVPLLAWPALFGSLGFNFLQSGITPPGGGGPEFGFLIPGVVFELMGVIPLVLGIVYGGSGGRVSRERLRAAQLAAGLRPPGRSTTSGSPSAFGPGRKGEAAGASPAGSSQGPGASVDLASELERLADLHARGELTDVEFAVAKAALLASVAPTSEGRP
jgi:putative oligomerization/nucleic acid binding protein